MNFTDEKISEIFYLIDSFCKEFIQQLSNHLMSNSSKQPSIMSDSEVITIMLLFHDKGYNCMKHFYTQHVQKQLTRLFPTTVSYNRFTELMYSVNLQLELFVKKCVLVRALVLLTLIPRRLGYARTSV